MDKYDQLVKETAKLIGQWPDGTPYEYPPPKDPRTSRVRHNPKDRTSWGEIALDLRSLRSVCVAVVGRSRLLTADDYQTVVDHLDAKPTPLTDTDRRALEQARNWAESLRTWCPPGATDVDYLDGVGLTPKARERYKASAAREVVPSWQQMEELADRRAAFLER